MIWYICTQYALFTSVAFKMSYNKWLALFSELFLDRWTHLLPWEDEFDRIARSNLRRPSGPTYNGKFHITKIRSLFIICNNLINMKLLVFRKIDYSETYLYTHIHVLIKHGSFIFLNADFFHILLKKKIPIFVFILYVLLSFVTVFFNTVYYICFANNTEDSKAS